MSSESSCYVKPEIIHGLGLEVISCIIETFDTLCAVNDVIDKCGVTRYCTACRIAEVLSNIFHDMDTDFEADEDIQI